MFLLSEVKPPNSIELSLYARVFHAAQPCLVISRVNCLQFYVVHVSESPSLELVESVNVEDKIIALNKIRHPELDSDCLVLLTESYKVLFLWYDKSISKFSVVFNVTLDSVQQQAPLDSPPRIVVDSSSKPLFFLVYCFENFVQLFTLNDKWIRKPVASTKRQKKQAPNDLVTVVLFSVGNVVLQDMQFVRSKYSVLAFLYRDYNYNYSLRYYDIDARKKTFTLRKQFEEFQDVPSALILPATGGSLILANGFLFYFPDPTVRTIDISSTDESFSFNREHMLITKRLDSKKPSDLSVFHRSAVIDEKRILLVNNKGQTNILYIDSSRRSEYAFELKDITFVNLGFSTVPSNVHHITKNLFFISSKLSQSILFRIMAKDPYVNVCQFFPSSPPILDIKLMHTNHSEELLVCQGGYESGELRRVSSRRQYLTRLYKLNLALASPEIKTCGTIDGYVRIRASDLASNQHHYFKTRNHEFTEFRQSDKKPLEEYVGDGKQITVYEHGVMDGLTYLFSESVTFAKVDSAEFYVVIIRGNILMTCFSTGLTRQCGLKSKAEVSSLDYVAFGPNRYLVLVTFWDGSLELYCCDDQESDLVHQETIEPNGISISSGCLSYADQTENSVWVFLLTSNSELVEFFFDVDSGTKDPYRSSASKYKGLPLLFKKGPPRPNNVGSGQVIMFNEQDLFGLHNDAATNYNSTYPISIEELPTIQDVVFAEESTLLVASQNELTVFEIKPTDARTDVIFSNDLNLNTVPVPGTGYSILITSQSLFNESENDYTRKWFLLLVDAKRILVENTICTGDFANFADLCFLETDPATEEKYALLLCNSTIPEKMFRILKVSKKSLLIDQPIKIIGLAPTTEVTYKSIVKLDGERNTFLVNGLLSFILRIDSTLEGEIFKAAFFHPPIFAAVGQNVGDKMVVADVMKGINIFKWNKDDDDNYLFDLSSVKTVLDSNLITDLAVYKTKFKSHILAVDSLGNITGLSLGELVSSVEEFLAFNIGQGINCIHRVEFCQQLDDLVAKFDSVVEKQKPFGATFVLGTLNGGLYSLCELLDPEDEIEDVLVECQKELVEYKRSLTDLEAITKKDKFSLWRSKNDKKTLRRDEDGKPLLVDNRDVIFMDLFQKWLLRDAVVAKASAESDQSLRELDQMRSALSKCYKNKSLIQSIIHELTHL